jgi:hypothetical protein
MQFVIIGCLAGVLALGGCGAGDGLCRAAWG